MVHACKSNREEDHRTTGGQPSGSLQPPGPGGSIFLLASLGLGWVKATGNHTEWGEKKKGGQFTEQLDTPVAFLGITVSLR